LCMDRVTAAHVFVGEHGEGQAAIEDGLLVPRIRRADENQAVPVERPAPPFRVGRLGPGRDEDEETVPVFWRRSGRNVDGELLFREIDRLFAQLLSLRREELPPSP